MFKIGMKVICICGFEGDSYTQQGLTKHPKKGDILTIRDISENYLRFEELPNPLLRYLSDNGLVIISEVKFNPNKFVPLQSDFKKITYEKIIEQIEISSN